ncbi:MAG: hypothetical protein D6812_15255 [Deltaproteobacteria bacterium]|nr:MAG: hypothetical protein D6812_15255 [Deltaproteobacteria bacterium]
MTAIVSILLLVFAGCSASGLHPSAPPPLPPVDPNPYVAAAEEKFVLRSGGTLRVSLWRGDLLWKVVEITPEGKVREQEIAPPSGEERAALSCELQRDGEVVRVPLEGIRPFPFEPYRIGPEDVIQVSVWKDPGLSATVPVRPDGMISLPLLDDIRAAGLTTLELRDEITERLQEFIETPDVTVTVTNVNSYRFFVVGKVNQPGVFPLRQQTSLFQALTLAGGLTEFAHPREMFILRYYGEKEVRIPVPYKDLLSGGEGGKTLMLRPGDTIVVP